MNLPDIPLLSLVRERMSWLNARQNILSQNVSNADTPSYTARDLKELDFDRLVRRSAGGENALSGLRTTNARHIGLTPTSTTSYADYDSPDVIASPTGNTVSLEQQMIKVADTQVQYQAATNLYAKALGMMRTALGKPGH